MPSTYHVNRPRKIENWEKMIVFTRPSFTAFIYCILLSVSLNSYGQSGGPIFDLVLKNGRIVDGSGNPWFPGDLGVKDGLIVKVGNLSDAAGERTIDATGHVLSPGFIDIHNHSDSQVLTNPRRRTTYGRA